jgi:hypothetical protein
MGWLARLGVPQDAGWHNVDLLRDGLMWCSRGDKVLSELTVSFVFCSKMRENTKRWADLARKLSISARRGLERRVDWPGEIVPAYECGEAAAPPCALAPASSACSSLVKEEGTCLGGRRRHTGAWRDLDSRIADADSG